MVGPAWDSLLGKLIITGATRQQALQRPARALAEFQVDGLATALPFHRAVVADSAFAPELHGTDGPFTAHTRWIETEFRTDIPPHAGDGTHPAQQDAQGGRQTITSKSTASASRSRSQPSPDSAAAAPAQSPSNATRRRGASPERLQPPHPAAP